MVGLLLSILGLPVVGPILKQIGRMFGITDRPNLLLGEAGKLVTVEQYNDPRPGYRAWWHVDCIDRQRSGQSRWMPTLDAIECTVRLQFVSAQHIYSDEGVILIDASTPPGQRVTLYRDRLTQIPVYFEAVRSDPRHPLSLRPLVPGTYISGANFLYQPALIKDQHLDAGEYAVTVRLTHSGRDYCRRFDLTVPAVVASKLPEVHPEHSELRAC